MSSRKPHYPSIPVLCTSGSYYQVGYNVGFTFGHFIRRYCDESVNVNSIDIPFNKTVEGKRFYDATLAVCKENFPHYIRELEGIADGSGLEFRLLFLLNISKEVHNVLRHRSWTPLATSVQGEITESSGCSDVFLNTPDIKILAHNEDCDPQIKPYGYIVKARIVEDEEEKENFTAFCYPGVLPGSTVGFNKHGLVFTVDGLYASFIAQGAPSRMFLGRSVLKSRSVEEAIQRLKNPGYGVAYSFTVNIADIKHPESMWSVELGPQVPEAAVHVHEVPEQDPNGEEPCHYWHFNNTKHLQFQEIPKYGSTIHRTRTAESLPSPTNRADIMSALGDTSDSDYPIFRTKRPTDRNETIFTTVIDVLKNKVDFYQGNPGLPDLVPVVSFPVLESL